MRATRLADALRRVEALRHQTPSATAATNTGVQTKRQHFSVQERGRLLLVPVADVIYLKAELKYVTLRTKAREYLIEASLQSLEEELATTFVRVHRNALVARNAIIGVERASHGIDGDHDNERTLDSWQVILRDIVDRVPVSRRQWAVVKALVR